VKYYDKLLVTVTVFKPVVKVTKKLKYEVEDTIILNQLPIY